MAQRVRGCPQSVPGADARAGRYRLFPIALRTWALGARVTAALRAYDKCVDLFERADYRAPASSECKGLCGFDLRPHRAGGKGVLTQFLWRDLAEGALGGLAPVEVDRRYVSGDDQYVGVLFAGQQAAAQILIDDCFHAMQIFALAISRHRKQQCIRGR